MGFGILFIGYVLAYLFILTPFGYFFELVGTGLMLYAFTKLAEYNKSFKYAFVAALPLLLIALFSSVINTMANFGSTYVPPELLITVVSYVKLLCNMIFHFACLTAVADIAKETGSTKIRSAAYRNLIIYGLYFALVLVSNLPALRENESVYAVLALAGNIFWLAWVMLNGILLYSCYMRICDENDTEMTAKASRFGVINRLRGEFERKEERAREADRRYLNERAERKKNKKKKK